MLLCATKDAGRKGLLRQIHCAHLKRAPSRFTQNDSQEHVVNVKKECMG